MPLEFKVVRVQGEEQSFHRHNTRKVDELMDISGAEYQKNWGVQCGQFLREFNTEVVSKQTGSGTCEIYKSTWCWYKHLEFVKFGKYLKKDIHVGPHIQHSHKALHCT